MTIRIGGGSDFGDAPGKTFGIYVAGVAAFFVLLAILEQVGVPDLVIGYLFVFVTLAVYAGIGIVSRTMLAGQFFVAGRRVPAVYNGLAAAADWISGAAFIGMAGTLFALGYDGLAFVVGWTGGFVLLAVLIAPYLRKFGAYTVPDFLAARFDSRLVRFLGVVVLVSCSFVYVTAQVSAIGIVASRLLGMRFEVAVFAGGLAILLSTMLGGMRSVTWTQVAQYVVLIFAYMAPVAILSVLYYGVPVPQLVYGQTLQEIGSLEQSLTAQGLAPENLAAYVQPFTNLSPLNFFAVILCLMVGTASLPHIVMRYFTTASVRDTRRSVGWSLLFVVLFFVTAPAYAAFAKLEVYQHVIGAAMENLPSWIYTYGNMGLVQICGADASSLDAIRDACAARGTSEAALALGDLRIHPDAIVMATPEIAGMPYVIVGLVAAGALAAALSTANGLLLAIANSLSHDVYYKTVNTRASTARRLTIARLVLVLLTVLAAWLATANPADILSIAAWAFSLAAAGNFPALVLGIWWKRCTSLGAIAGIVSGFSVCAAYLVVTRYFPAFGVEALGMSALTDAASGAPVADVAAALADPTTANAVLASKVGWFNVNNISAALFGLPVGAIVTVAISLVTAEPSKEIKDLVDDIRTPRGGALTDGGDPLTRRS